MSMTDPIADMLTRVRNAHSVGKPTVSMPSSKKLVEIARIMQEEGYIQGFEIIDGEPRATLGDHDEVRPQEGQDYPWHQAHFQAWSAHLRWQERPSARSRRPRYRNHLDANGVMTDRDAPQQGHRRRGYRLHLVGKEGKDMSRIGKQPVAVPANVEVTIDGHNLTVKGPKGELHRSSTR